MLIFIFSSLLLGFWVKSGYSENWLFLSDIIQYFGVALMLINLIAVAVKVNKIPFALRYDLFALGSLLTWFSYWSPFFRDESPIFYVFPLYFALMSSAFSLLFMTQRGNIQKEDIHVITGLPGFVLANPLLIMIGVMISLVLPEHFMLYPITMTLLMIRFFLECHLNVDQ